MPKNNFTFVPDWEKRNRRKEKKAHLPVILKLQTISRSGKVNIKFNQKLKIPKQFRKKVRKLQTDKDGIFEISVSNKDGEKHEYAHEIDDWNEDGVVVQLNFDNPVAISQNSLHLAKIVVKKPEVFESAESG